MQEKRGGFGNLWRSTKAKEEKPADETQPQEQKQERLPEEKLWVEIRGV